MLQPTLGVHNEFLDPGHIALEISARLQRRRRSRITLKRPKHIPNPPRVCRRQAPCVQLGHHLSNPLDQIALTEMIGITTFHERLYRRGISLGIRKFFDRPKGLTQHTTFLRLRKIRHPH